MLLSLPPTLISPSSSMYRQRLAVDFSGGLPLMRLVWSVENVSCWERLKIVVFAWLISSAVSCTEVVSDNNA